MGRPVKRDLTALLAKPGASEAFWLRVDVRGLHDCWPFSGPRDRDGYGEVCIYGIRCRAHRVALAISDGMPPEGANLACHHCDNKQCCNPLHLYWGTVKANAVDCLSRNGWRRITGSNHRDARLTEADVSDILADLRPHSRIARIYGVSTTAISRIRAGKEWRHVPRPSNYEEVERQRAALRWDWRRA